MNTTLQRLRAVLAATARNLFQKNCGVVVMSLSCRCGVVVLSVRGEEGCHLWATVQVTPTMP